MKTLKNTFQPDKSSNEECPKKLIAGLFFKPVFIIVLLSYITLMSSCFIGYHNPRHERRGEVIDNSNHDNHHDHDDHHDNNDHHGPQ